MAWLVPPLSCVLMAAIFWFTPVLTAIARPGRVIQSETLLGEDGLVHRFTLGRSVLIRS